MILLYDILSSYLIEQARVHLESGNGSRLAEYILLLSTHNLLCGLLWLLIDRVCVQNVEYT